MPKEIHIPHHNLHVPKAYVDGNGTYNDMIRIERHDGSLVAFNHQEARQALQEIIVDELHTIGYEKAMVIKRNIEIRVNLAFDAFENKMTRYINDRVDEVSEQVIEKITTYQIEEAVNNRVEEILKEKGL